FIDTDAVRPTQFDLSEAERELLYAKGRQAATDFLDGDDDQEAWDFDRYRERFRTGPSARWEGEPRSAARISRRPTHGEASTAATTTGANIFVRASFVRARRFLPPDPPALVRAQGFRAQDVRAQGVRPPEPPVLMRAQRCLSRD